MAKAGNKEVNEKVFFNLKGMKVMNARRIPNSTTISFSLCGNGLGLYNLRLVKGGPSGAFIATPQSKGKDDKYYPQYALYLSDEDEDRVIKAVIDKLPAEKPEEDTL